jgi:hypothetical protein
MDKATFEKIMKEFSLSHISNLNYIDEFPVVTEALWMHNPDIVRTEYLIEKFKQMFIEQTE